MARMAKILIDFQANFLYFVLLLELTNSPVPMYKSCDTNFCPRLNAVSVLAILKPYLTTYLPMIPFAEQYIQMSLVGC